MGIKRAGIYVIERIETDQKYVGQGWDVKHRMWQGHKGCLLIYRAIRKYSNNEFKRRVVLYCEEFEMDYYEIKLIKIFRSSVEDGGYNVLPGGKSGKKGRKLSPETIEKIRQSLLGRTFFPESLERISQSKMGNKNPMYGIPRTLEQKQAQSKIMSGENHPLYGKFGKDNPKFGRKSKNTSSRYRGVSVFIDKRYKGWSAGIRENGKRKHICVCKSEEECAHRYDDYVIKNNLPNPLNFPDNIHPYWELEQ